MAKLKSDPIVQRDLIAFLDGHSDFAFEAAVLRELIGCGFTCEHGGTYDDPVTNKPRQFDIRATKSFGRRYLRLAVECKNLRANYPLLVTCLPRHDDEAFHEIAYSVDPEKHPIEVPDEPYFVAMLPTSKNFRLAGEHTPYRPGEPVGKSCHQVGRAESNAGEIVASDGDIYEKWAQAMSSADDLTYLACSDGRDRTGCIALSLVLPILVVPNDRLWQTEYDNYGSRLTDPAPTDRCPFFVNRKYYHGSVVSDELTISHLEIVTVNGLLRLVDQLCGDDKRLENTFPFDHIAEMLTEA